MEDTEATLYHLSDMKIIYIYPHTHTYILAYIQTLWSPVVHAEHSPGWVLQEGENDPMNCKSRYGDKG